MSLWRSGVALGEILAAGLPPGGLAQDASAASDDLLGQTNVFGGPCAQPCRFFTDDVCETVDSVNLQKGGPDDGEANIADGDVRDISAKLKARWD